jgi:hypothetical protein
MIRHKRPLLVTAVALALVLLSRPALAGPPLICFPFEIGAARTLPMGHGNWHDTDPKYDVSHLVADTLAILTPETPVLVRMETIRRAAIYASTHPKEAHALFGELQARAAAPQPAVAALAVFDFGYFVETCKEASYLFKEPLPALDRIDGYQLVLQAHALQNDPAMQHAAQLIVAGRPRGTR